MDSEGRKLTLNPANPSSVLSLQSSAFSCQPSGRQIRVLGISARAKMVMRCSLIGAKVDFVGPFRKLFVWQKAHQLTLEVYRSTRSFSEDEKYGLTAQMRRCAVSIGANIAEGSARKSDRDFARFVQIAFASASELEQHLLLAVDLDISRESLTRGSCQRRRGEADVDRVEPTTDG